MNECGGIARAVSSARLCRIGAMLTAMVVVCGGCEAPSHDVAESARSVARADAVTTRSDAVTTHSEAVATHSDAVTTHSDAVTTPPVSSGRATASRVARDANPVRAAMFAIYFHARLGQRTDLPPDLAPMPLDDAVAIVARADGRFADLDRRRAIAVMASESIDRFRDQLIVLDAPIEKLKEWVGEFRTLAPPSLAASLAFSMSADGEVADGCPFTIVEPAVVVTSVGPTALQPGCPALTGVDMSTVVVGKTTMKATGPFDQVPALMDPQNWDVCSPDYFEATYVTAVDGADEAIVDSTTHDALEESSPPPAGTSWERILFERFVIDWAELGDLEIRSALWNTLDIKSTATSTTYSALYCLDRSIWHEIPTGIPGVGSGPGGIDVDEGVSAAKIDPATGVISFEGVKHIHFDGLPMLYDEYVNFLAPIYMAMAGAEIERMLCCELPPEPIGPPGMPVLIP